jgi:hypothetical protein
LNPSRKEILHGSSPTLELCVLAKELNVTHTAERVNTVQSNVTSQIQSLEAELGYPLFENGQGHRNCDRLAQGSMDVTC